MASSEELGLDSPEGLMASSEELGLDSPEGLMASSEELGLDSPEGLMASSEGLRLRLDPRLPLLMVRALGCLEARIPVRRMRESTIKICGAESGTRLMWRSCGTRHQQTGQLLWRRQ